MDILIHGAQDTTLPLTLIFTVFSFVIIAFGMLMGAWRGVHRSFVRVGTLVLTAVAAFALAVPVVSRLIDMLYYLILPEDVSSFLRSSAFVEIVNGYYIAVTAPFIFVILFMVFSIISFIIYLILAFSIFPGKKYREGADGKAPLRRHRLFGMLVGALSGMLVVACIHLPVYGYSGLVTDDLGETLEFTSDYVEFKNTKGVAEVISEITLGEMMFDKLTTADAAGRHISIRKDVPELASATARIVNAFKEPAVDWNEEDKIEVEQVFDSMQESEIVSTVISAGAETFRDGLRSGDGIGKFEIPEEYTDAVADVLDKLSDKDSEEFTQIVETVKDMVFIFVDSIQRNSASEVSLELILADEKLLSDFLEALLTAPVFDPITVALFNSGLDLMVAELGINDVLRVDEVALANATDAERRAEAKFLADVIPQMVNASDAENGEETLEFSGASNVVKLTDSLLLGSATKKAVRSLAANLLVSLKSDSEGDTDITDGKTEAEVIESIPELIVEGGLSQEVVDALPDIVKDVELDADSADTLQQVVDELSDDEEFVDAIPDYLREFLERNGIALP